MCTQNSTTKKIVCIKKQTIRTGYLSLIYHELTASNEWLKQTIWVMKERRRSLPNSAKTKQKMEYFYSYVGFLNFCCCKPNILRKKRSTNITNGSNVVVPMKISPKVWQKSK